MSLNLNLFQRLMKSAAQNDWKYLSKTECPKTTDKVSNLFGIVAGTIGTVGVSYHLTGKSYEKTRNREIDPFPAPLHWIVSLGGGMAAGLVASLVAYVPSMVVFLPITLVPIYVGKKIKEIEIENTGASISTKK